LLRVGSGSRGSPEGVVIVTKVKLMARERERRRKEDKEAVGYIYPLPEESSQHLCQSEREGVIESRI
jgi:hypothetical protein